MKHFKLIQSTFLLAIVLFSGVSCTQESSLTEASLTEESLELRGKPTAGPTIVDLALATPDLSILVAALTREDLSTDFVELLNGPQSFTVVAPNNDAFVNLLNAVPEWSSLADIPTDVLEAVLKYHISPRPNGTAKKLAKGTSIPTLLRSQKWSARPSGSTLEIVANSNSALVLTADIEASNGYVHIIDTVILP